MRTTSTKALLAGVPPLLIYLHTASGYAHWFDSGELVAAAWDFGISHPPGHPLAGLVLGAANAIPVGALSFRIALLCALLVAVAVVAAFFAIEHTLERERLVQPSLAFPLALGAAWWIAGTQGWWFQAVRPEVYALQAALCCVGIERLIRASGPKIDARPLFQASLAWGLALGNHHYIALLLIVPAAWLIVPVVRACGWRTLAWSAGFVTAGLLVYLYLPLRALAGPYLDLGDPSSPARFWWVVTAAAFQKSVNPDTVAPFHQNLIDVLIAMGTDFHLAMMAAALLGAYFMLRVKASRRYALFWLTLWLVYVLGRAALGFVSGNPDALAYFMLAYVSLGAFVAFAAGILLSALGEAVPSRPSLTPTLSALLAGAALLQFARTEDRSALTYFVDTDVFDDGLRRDLPPRAVVLSHNPQTIFRYWGGEAEERNRPDVTLVPLPLLTYPKLVDRLVNDEPELTPLLRNYLLDGRLNAAELQSLAALRPVYVEMDVRVPQEMMGLLIPEHLYHRVLTADMTDTDEAKSMHAHAALWGDLYQRIGMPIDPHTRTQLIWRHYADSLYFAGVGDIEAARRTVKSGLAINSLAEQLVALEEALSQAPAGEPIDIAPFTVR